MTTDSLFDALENCLQTLNQGGDVESCLVRYPALADELRPILVAAVQARAAAVTNVPEDIAWRSRERVLYVAAQMRNQQAAAPVLTSSRKKGFFGARVFRLAVTAALVVIFLLTGGTRLVNASSGALPGDRLYPVKRGWEGVQLAFVFDPQTKVELEHKFDHERVQEIEELYSEKRIEQVNFEGVVETQQTGVWRISGLNVAIDDETASHTEITSGATVQIIGETDDGIIKPGQIILIATPGVTPTAISTSTPGTIQENSPEGGEKPKVVQTPDAGEGSGNNGSKKIEDSTTPNTSEKSGGEDGTSISPNGTPHPHREDSGSDSGSGGGDSHPPTDDHGEGDH